MNQEDLNALMRNPWEAAKKPRPQPLPECPQCGERYCGDGIAFCTECANTVTPNAKLNGGLDDRIGLQPQGVKLCACKADMAALRAALGESDEM